jgi:uncharacterized MnhB-related membrane protein
VFAVQAIRARRLLTSALWLGGTSALLSVALYVYGAYQAAVIELSVGAGLVTVLFVFAINVAGEGAIGARAPFGVPRPLAWGLVAVAVILLGWSILLLGTTPAASTITEPALATVLWQERGLDVLVQVVLIFAGVLGLLGLLAEARPPLGGAAAAEVAARRDRELQALEEQALTKEKERV